jgi:cell wall-associated NlpC family hydrolase
MSTAALDVSKLVLNGQDVAKHYTDLAGALADPGVSVRQTVTGASTVDITLADAKRTLLTSAALTTRSRLVLDNAGYTLVSVGKSGARVNLTFEDDAVALLRTHTGTRKAAAGTTTRAGFVTTLIREVPDLRVVVAPGSSKNLVELSRGSGAAGSVAASESKEDTWTAAGRIMGEIGWRVFCYRGTVTIAPDSWLIAHNGKPFVMSPDTKGVHDIDFQWDTGKPAATATITADAGFRDLAPGTPVTLQHMGPANGSWLVETIERTAASKTVTVSAVRPQPSLPEPADAKAGVGNFGIPAFLHDYLGDTTASAGSTIDSSFTLQPTGATGLDAITQVTAEQFVRLAYQQRGKPYVYGAHGPNAWDCSGFVMDMAKRAAGVSISAPVSNIAATCRRAGTTTTVAQAAYARGALIWRQRGGGAHDHIVISLGDGEHTIEAMGRAYGVVVGKIAGRDWTGAGWAPGIPVKIPASRDLRPG